MDKAVWPDADLYLRLASTKVPEIGSRARTTITHTIETSDQDQPNDPQSPVGLPAR